ncbi:MAG: SpoIID/LytB domain-containing protein, partial [bacterium]|nr:SpoIID/LytB domain-containing protein [bacterium]
MHSLPLETYLVGTVASEVPQSWPDETLKAQAIAARTYAVWQTSRREGKNYDVKSSVMDQVYKGVKNEHSKAVKAVNDTKGQILSYNKKPVQAYFHSNCGGKTENAKDVWGMSLNYLPSSSCTYGKSDPKYYWTYSISKKSLNEALSKILPGPITKIKIIKKTSSKRAKTLEIFNKKQSKKISGEVLRGLLGYSSLRSTLIDSIRFGFSEVTFKGKGYGHGVGMCQWGAA